ncbi:Disintegrin and metalloproteinase domain-containing protein 12 [Lamellibrachia satsuma]|nr:Disintegrin and metalloproteinase domain-containing protein 12 [Lamellibrachia satsuma]
MGILDTALYAVLILSLLNGIYSKKSEQENDLDYEDPDGDKEAWPDATTADVGLDRKANRHLLDTIPTPYEVVYPSQSRKVQLPTLDTRDYRVKQPIAHFHHTSVEFHMAARRYKMRLELNRELLAKGLTLRRGVDEHNHITEELYPEHCYYQGYVRRVPRSMVAVSTCRGISGLIWLENATYVIRPLKTRQTGNRTYEPHVVYKSVSPSGAKCAAPRGMWQSFQELHKGEYLRRLKIVKVSRADWDALADTKRLDLALVCDHALYEQFNASYSAVMGHLLMLANIVDKLYSELNVRISLVHLDVWNVIDRFYISPLVRETLDNFMAYSQETVSQMKPPVAQLLTGQRFHDGEVGMSIPDSVCTSRAVGVSHMSHIWNIETSGVILTHQVAHTLGLTHDSSRACHCEAPSGCIMENQFGGTFGYPRQFSTCSHTQLNMSLLSGLGVCLFDDQYEVAFSQQCGNGVVERSEECDCVSRLSCLLDDPCCDPDTCLLRPWANCRSGQCCHNCTVLPKTSMCRKSEVECDVPEFCDGTTGQCPHNAIVQDGQPCRNNQSYCYHGNCHTGADQCSYIWGPGSRQAEDKCYSQYNPSGRFDGHCGRNHSSGRYYKCDDGNVKCGLLHCIGGAVVPVVGRKRIFATTTFMTDDGMNYTCKTFNGAMPHPAPQLGMVKDGTKCKEGAICINRQCMPVRTLIVASCPHGIGNRTCSGKGVCTSDVKCFCQPGYVGTDCSIRQLLPSSDPMPAVTSPPTTTVTTTMSTTTNASDILLVVTQSTITPHIFPKISRRSTRWIMIILACVAGGGLVILGFSMLCYRRRVPVQLKRAQIKKRKKKKKKKDLFLGLPPSPISRKEDFSDSGSNRLISFGSMPSYRADKIKKATKNALRNSGALSETESDHSRTTDRDSTELKMASLAALPLAKPPEKGILKKMHGRSMDNFKVATPEEMVPLQKRSAVTIPRMSAHYTDDFKLSSQGHGKLGGEDSDSSEDSDNSIVGDANGYAVLRSPDHHKTGIQMDGVVSPECPVRPSLEVSRDGGVTGAKNRILKLKNLNELLRQIDEQFNNVLKQTDPVASPGGSSDTEADRQGAVYQASEDGLGMGFSPPHRSPVLSPSSPDPLLSPGDIGDFPAMSPMSECYEKPSRFHVRKSAPTSQPGGPPDGCESICMLVPQRVVTRLHSPPDGAT